ncbi:hypothetical protein I4S21_002656 [Salmonella enterica]|nr:hypothetical protein [Salmonella enterica]EFO6476672.1 hypothetical protein [Salmonella enterica]EFQ3646640.1 hypothetical protein [Salmonella enterica]EFQ8798628.1 hypothetical protein [Salmonella enterica]EFT2014221.1 hypothetical protein [Salmonella enterica]
MCLTGIRYATEVMVVGEGLLSAARFALRVVACGNAFSLRSNRTLVEASHPSRTERYETVCLTGIRYATGVMVVGEGLLSAARFTLRVVACGNAFSLRSNRTLVEASHPSRTERYETLCLTGIRYATEAMVVGEG